MKTSADFYPQLKHGSPINKKTVIARENIHFMSPQQNSRNHDYI